MRRGGLKAVGKRRGFGENGRLCKSGEETVEGNLNKTGHGYEPGRGGEKENRLERGVM